MRDNTEIVSLVQQRATNGTLPGLERQHTSSANRKTSTTMSSKTTEAPAELVDEADLELLAQAGKPVPAARRYVFKVNDRRGVSEQPQITGAEILTATKFVPPENFTLSMKRGKQWVPVKLKEIVDLRQPGIEIFRANPKDATDGSP